MCVPAESCVFPSPPPLCFSSSYPVESSHRWAVRTAWPPAAPSQSPGWHRAQKAPFLAALLKKFSLGWGGGLLRQEKRYKCSGREASTKRDLPRDTAACCVWTSGLALAGGRSRGPFCSPGYPSSASQVASRGPWPSVCPSLSPVLPAGLPWPPGIPPGGHNLKHSRLPFFSAVG